MKTCFSIFKGIQPSKLVFKNISFQFLMSILLFQQVKMSFSTSHFIPHIRALVPCPGLTSEACVVASTSVPLTPTEILNLYFCRPTEILILYFCRPTEIL